jgi:hypothetical protein
MMILHSLNIRSLQDLINANEKTTLFVTLPTSSFERSPDAKT